MAVGIGNAGGPPVGPACGAHAEGDHPRPVSSKTLVVALVAASVLFAVAAVMWYRKQEDESQAEPSRSEGLSVDDRRLLHEGDDVDRDLENEGNAVDEADKSLIVAVRGSSGLQD